jgi:hypothetical protein
VDRGARSADEETIMESTIKLTFGRYEYVPTGAARVAWLEAHGVRPATTDVPVTASLATWARVQCDIEADGAVRISQYSEENPGYQMSETMSGLKKIAQSRLAAGEKNVELTDADVATVAEGIEALRARLAAKADERKATQETERAATLAKMRAAGVEALICRNEGGWRRRSISYVDARDALGPDCWDRADDEIERRNAADAAKRAAYDVAIRTLASKVEHLARSAADGYDVEKSLLDHLALTLASAAAGGCEYMIDHRSWTYLEDRSAPRPEAFALLDRVTAACDAANAELPAAIGQWKVSRISRLDVCPHFNRKHVVTAVVAMLDTPYAVREVTWSTESMACDHED